MTLYLIAHKVRGELAFDVAEPMEMADGLWWIIPTSGHRAYPVASWDLRYLYDDPDFQISVLDAQLPPLNSVRDHYTVVEALHRRGISMTRKNTPCCPFHANGGDLNAACGGDIPAPKPEDL